MLKLQKKILPRVNHANQKSGNIQFSGSSNFFSSEKKPIESNNSFFTNTAYIQPKLTINQPGDHFEQEADAVADKVTQKNQQTVRPGHNPDNISTSFFGGNLINRSFFPGENQEVKNTSQNSLLRKTEPGVSITTAVPSKPAVSQTDISVNTEEDNIQKEQKEGFLSSDSQPSKIFENKLSTTKGNGSPLSKDTRQEMESGIGADFSSVKVHTGENAVQMSTEIGARAFTHQNEIYFNQNQYQPDTSEGKHLLAHELTHTVQQGASIQTKRQNISTAQIHVQRGLFDSLGSFIGGIRDRVLSFVQNLPGFFLFTVLLGRNPLTDEHVDRNGRNIIKGLLLLLPHGQQKYDKLEQEGAIDRSATWIDQQLATIESIREQASSTFDRAIHSLSPGDILSPGAALNRIRNFFNPVVNRAINFARRVGRQVLQFLKDAVLNSLVDFIRTRTRGYPLLRVLLGRDPVTNEEVPRNMENIIHAFLMLSESGEAYYNKMKESGALDRAISWMREQIATLPTVEEVIGAFTRAWRSVSFEDLFQPVAAFQRIYGILSDPIGRILRFVGAVAMQILIFIKDAMLGWLRSHANEIPGYHLLTVILGRDPFTNEPVARNATNLIHGFMGLIPGGEEQFQQMQESGVIPRLAGRIESAVETLGITWDFIRNLFISIWQSLRITDLLLPLVAFARIITRFREPIGRLFEFIRVVITAVIEVLLRMMNFPIDLIGQIIDNAMQAYEDIKRDPIGFLKNLMRAAKKGFQQFFDNFVQHLIGGVTGWLFGELEEAGIQPPQDISFRSILGMALEVLGITVDNIFARLARKIGQDRVDRIRSVVDRLTGIWEFVRDVMDRGAVAIWERIQEQLSNLWDIVVEGIRNWIVSRIIQGVTTRLLSMLDPTGIMAVVNGFITFFRAVQSFIEQLTRILQIINNFIQGVGQIARGNIQQAADFLENALARALPVAIAFLANQVGLRGLGRRVGQMIERAREYINRGIDWLLDRALQIGRAILDRLTGRGAAGNEPETGTDEQSRENNKRMAIQEVQRRITSGIRRSELRNLLQNLRQRYSLRRAELNSSDDVIIENSDPVTIPARPIVVNQTNNTTSSTTAPVTTSPTGNQVRIGNFTGTKDSGVQTIWGVLRSTGMNPPSWPVGADVSTADRPRTVEATLFGYPGENLEPEARNNSVTRNVGHYGNYESGLRRGNVSWRPSYDGGHILGHQFGGGETYDNLVPQQNNQLNRGLYARMETFIRDSLPASDATRLANPGTTQLQIRASMRYEPMIARNKYDIAKVASNTLHAESPNFYDSMDNSKRTESATVPERIPSGMDVEVELSADLNPASLATVEGTSSGSSDPRTRSTSRVQVTDPNDPTLVPESSGTSSSPEGESAQNESDGENAHAERRNWSATFNFTQGNQA